MLDAQCTPATSKVGLAFIIDKASLSLSMLDASFTLANSKDELPFTVNKASFSLQKLILVLIH